MGHFLFMGSTSFTHDDGATLIVDGILEASEPGPSSATFPPESFTWNGSTADFPFEFVYAECCGSPAVFGVEVIPPLPEPSSLALLCVALAGMGGALCRHRKDAQPDALPG
jgi:hypothetical protein